MKWMTPNRVTPVHFPFKCMLGNENGLNNKVWEKNRAFSIEVQPLGKLKVPNWSRVPSWRKCFFRCQGVRNILQITRLAWGRAKGLGWNRWKSNWSYFLDEDKQLYFFKGIREMQRRCMKYCWPSVRKKPLLTQIIFLWGSANRKRNISLCIVMRC